MHTVQLLLKPSKYERYEIDRRFRALAHLHNVCVKYARKCMVRLQYDKDYARCDSNTWNYLKNCRKKKNCQRKIRQKRKLYLHSWQKDAVRMVYQNPLLNAI